MTGEGETGRRETGRRGRREPHIASSPHPPSPIPLLPVTGVNISLFCLFLAIPYRAVYFPKPCEFPYVLIDFFAQMRGICLAASWSAQLFLPPGANTA